MPDMSLLDQQPLTSVETAKALNLINDQRIRTALCQAVDSVSSFRQCGIIARVRDPSGKTTVSRVRLPALPGDMNVILLFGGRVATPESPVNRQALRNELLAGGIACGAAILGWVAFVGGAFAAVPTGGVAIGFMVYDGIAAGAASIACINSGVRVLNEARGHHGQNEALDKNTAYSDLMLGLDGAGIGGFRGVAAFVPAASRFGKLASASSGVQAVRTIVLDNELRTQLATAVAAVFGIVGSNDAGVVGALETSAGVRFTIVLSN